MNNAFFKIATNPTLCDEIISHRELFGLKRTIEKYGLSPYYIRKIIKDSPKWKKYLKV